MGTLKATAKAQVTITLMVESKGNWGEDASIAEVRRMGEKETVDAVRRALNGSDLSYTIQGKPKVGLITWEPSHD